MDLMKGIVERYTNPSEDDYRHIERARGSETIESAALPGLNVRVDDIPGPG